MWYGKSINIKLSIIIVNIIESLEINTSKGSSAVTIALVVITNSY